MWKEENMRFEDVLHTGKLWAVVYDGDNQDILTKTLSGWMDPLALSAFFSANREDLSSFYHVTRLDQAILDTIADASSLASLFLDNPSDTDLNALFRPLENDRIREMLLSREKAKGKRISTHPSWLRLYAIKLDDHIFLVTGGAIKLTHRMRDRQHTQNELSKLNLVRNYLIENGVFDAEGLKDYIDSE